MAFLTKLAFKNWPGTGTGRSSPQSSLPLPSYSYILFDSLIGGMIEMSYATITDYETGHLQVMTEGVLGERNGRKGTPPGACTYA